MAFTDLLKRAERLVSENSTTILTGIGVTGTVTTAYLTGRASFKAASILRDEERDSVAANGGSDVEIPFREKVRLVWPLYIPAAGVGSATIVSIIMANRLSSKKAAALAAAYGISERAFQEYKEKVVEHLGEGRERRLRDEIAQDRITANPIGKEVIIAGSGEVLFFDALTGRYFMSTMEAIRKAENKINAELLNHMYTSLSSFYDEIGLPPTAYSDEVGWNNINNGLVEVAFSTTMSADDRPCIVIDFTTPPVPEYSRLY